MTAQEVELVWRACDSERLLGWLLLCSDDLAEARGGVLVLYDTSLLLAACVLVRRGCLGIFSIRFERKLNGQWMVDHPRGLSADN